MVDVLTTSSALSAAMTFKVQRGVLDNLRAELVFANDAWSEQGSFDSGRDTLLFIAVPDITLNVTPLVEGTRPDKKAMSISTVTVAASQYGDLVSITDLAKVKSPIEIVPIAIERLTRQSKESIDQITRDVIALGGTTFIGGVGAAATRAAIAASDLPRATDLRRLKVKMRKGKINPMSDGFYRLLVHPNIGFDLRNETATGSLNDVTKYNGATSKLVQGEIGEMEGFRVIEVVNAPTFASTTTVYRSIALGSNKGWGTGDLQTFQSFHVMPGGDHFDPLAQEELLGWKVAFGVAVLSNGYFYGMETAATNA